MKDQILVRNEKVEAASLAMCRHVSTFSAEAVNRLRLAGAVVVGIASMDEFGIGFSSVSCVRGPVLNAWAVQASSCLLVRALAGGSSGGCASAVALVCATMALGTDTGGSVRQPASLNGVVGLKPTYGRCSRWGVISYCSSLDQVGILAKTANGCARLGAAIFGKDLKDWNSVRLPVPEYKLYATRFSELSAIVLRKHAPCSDENWSYSLAALRRAKVVLAEVELSFTSMVLPCYCVLSAVECYSNLARYDGIRYGLKVREADAFSMYKKIRSAGFGVEVKRKLMTGVYILTSRLGYSRFYAKAERLRFLVKKRLVSLLEGRVGLVTPTMPKLSLVLGSDARFRFESDVYTVLSNITGLPSIQVPTGLDGNSLPFGIQVVGNAFDEAGLVDVCGRLQKVCGIVSPVGC